jgi:TRAP-type C4-dicarboxylate transport system substrate-binding protein
MSRWTKVATLAVAAVAAIGLADGASAEDRVRAIAAFPKNVGFAQSFARFVDKVNTTGKGTVQIQYVGGPETVPTFEQFEAVRKGVADMGYTPSSYYAGVVPEIEALVGGNALPWDVRANGGFELLNQIQQKKMNSYLLAWPDTGARFNFYLKNQPKVGTDGMPDFTGMKVRGAPAYRDIIGGLKGTFVNIAGPEVYTALERGTVDGFAWPAVTVMDFGWEKFVKYKITPAFFNLDLVINVNLDAWKKLSQASRDFLTKTSIAWEKESNEYWTKQAAIEAEELKKRGVQDFPLAAAAGTKYVSFTSETVWERMKGRDPSNYDVIRSKLYKAPGS